jgi:hypothetical protein
VPNQDEFTNNRIKWKTKMYPTIAKQYIRVENVFSFVDVCVVSSDVVRAPRL